VCSGYFCKHLKTEIGVERPESIHLNYHGLDPKVMALSATTTFNTRAASDPFRIVSIGRLVPTKGHDTLFRACAAILARTDTPLTIDLIGALVQANAFCLAPRMIPGHPPDGIPNVIAEAMALRVPIVTTAVSAIPELVENGESGLLAPDGMLVAMANRFVERGWRVHLICLTTAGELAERLDARVEFSVLGKRPGFDWRLPWRLRQAIARINPVAINSHLWTANLWTRVAFPFTRRRIVATEHSRDTWKPGHYRVIDRVLARWTHRLVAVSSDTAAFYTDDIGIDPARVTVINNGIDTARFSAGNGRALHAEWSPENAVLIGTVGRLVDAKNHLRLIEAADHMAAVARRVALSAFDLDTMVDRYADTFVPTAPSRTD